VFFIIQLEAHAASVDRLSRDLEKEKISSNNLSLKLEDQLVKNRELEDNLRLLAVVLMI
jgi:hypothetical protein